MSGFYNNAKSNFVYLKITIKCRIIHLRGRLLSVLKNHKS